MSAAVGAIHRLCCKLSMDPHWLGLNDRGLGTGPTFATCPLGSNGQTPSCVVGQDCVYQYGTNGDCDNLNGCTNILACGMEL
jgi:hypothetical protein